MRGVYEAAEAIAAIGEGIMPIGVKEYDASYDESRARAVRESWRGDNALSGRRHSRPIIAEIYFSNMLAIAGVEAG